MQEYTSKTHLQASVNASKDRLNPTTTIYDKASNSLLRLIVDTDTIDFYLDEKNKNILVAVRGTRPTYTTDLRADFMVAMNNLKNSNRYQNNKITLQKVMKEYPPDEYDYFLSGHSLGAAITSRILEDFPQVRFSINFNGAQEPRRFGNTRTLQNQKYYYIDEDFLYKSGGFLSNNKEVLKYRPDKVNTFFERLKSILVPRLTRVARSIDAHYLKNFKGRV